MEQIKGAGKGGRGVGKGGRAGRAGTMAGAEWQPVLTGACCGLAGAHGNVNW